MQEEIRKKYDEKLQRITTTISLREPDRVPINVGGNIFAVTEAGYTVAECIYDTTLEKAKDAVKQYLLKYDPDFLQMPVGYAGEGPVMELLKPTFMLWAGMPGNRIPENSIQQFVEFPILLDEEFEEFFSDRTGWILRHSMPKISEALKPLQNMSFPLSHRGLRQICREFSKPEVKEMIQTLWKADEMYKEHGKRMREVVRELSELGYPDMNGGKAAVPFDEYSDTLRGTLLSLTDLIEYPQYVERFIEELLPETLEEIKNMNKDGKKTGKFVNMTLHKGMDGFMSNEQYEKYYWRHLQQIICAIVDVGMVPYVFCEGKYSTRLDFLKDVPKGKVVYAFEDTPMELAKKKLGDVACITGGFPNVLLDFGKKQDVIDAVKRMIDDCAPGGGFIFRTKATLINAKRENVEAMFETIKDYGRY